MWTSNVVKHKQTQELYVIERAVKKGECYKLYCKSVEYPIKIDYFDIDDVISAKC